MIESLVVALAKNRVPVAERSEFDEKQRADFTRVTGIKDTAHFPAPKIDLIRSAAHCATEAWSDCKPPLSDCVGVIYVTQSPGRLSPCNAMDVAHAIGVRNVPVFDVNQSCTGFVYGLKLAHALVAGRPDAWVMLCGADALRADPSDTASMIFSDAAFACVVAQSFEHPSFYFTNAPEYASALHAPVQGNLTMQGGQVLDASLKYVPDAVKKFENATGRHDFFVQHQPNLSMQKMIAKRSGYETGAPTTVEKFGNLSLCSIPAVLVSHESALLGARLLLAGYGAGFSVALASTRWSSKPVARFV